MDDQTRCRYCDAVILDERAAVDHMFTWHPVRQPEWVRRAKEKRLPPKDLTGTGML